jgi:hypothetical protein
VSKEWVRQVFNCDLPHGEKVVLFVMAWFADKEGGSVRASATTISRDTGYHERQVRKILQSLKKSGYIVQVGRHGIERGYIPVYRLVLNHAPKHKDLHPIQDFTDDKDLQKVQGFSSDLEPKDLQFSPKEVHFLPQSPALVPPKQIEQKNGGNFSSEANASDKETVSPPHPEKRARTKRKTKTEPSPEANQLAELLRARILVNKPDFHMTPAELHRWAVEADRMLRRDARDYEKHPEHEKVPRSV